MSYEIASELSHRVLQEQRRRKEIASPPRYQAHQVVQALDTDEINTRFSVDEVLREDEIPTWHVHGKRRHQ